VQTYKLNCTLEEKTEQCLPKKINRFNPASMVTGHTSPENLSTKCQKKVCPGSNGLKWFDQKDPSELLINHLNFFGFWASNSLRYSNFLVFRKFSAYRQFYYAYCHHTEIFFSCIISMWRAPWKQASKVVVVQLLIRQYVCGEIRKDKTYEI
jgi:hypothetical protein